MIRAYKMLTFQAAALVGAGLMMATVSEMTKAAPPAAAVEIGNFTFKTPTLTVKPGTTVTWTNGDEDPHTVSATGGPFHSKTLTDGATFRYTFAKPGRYAYLCTIHPFMRGTVVVTG